MMVDERRQALLGYNRLTPGLAVADKLEALDLSNDKLRRDENWTTDEYTDRTRLC